jgi:kumamolisin
MADSQRIPLAGSYRDPAPGAQPVGEGFIDEPVNVTVRLRRRPSTDPSAKSEIAGAVDFGNRSIRTRPYLTREEYAALYGAAPADVETVRKFAAGFGLVETGSCAAERSLKFKGSRQDASRAFGTTLETYRYPYGKYRGRVGELHLPSSLAGVVEAVFGLDNRRQANALVVEESRNAPAQAKLGLERIRDLYCFPQDLSGNGECIAVLEFGGSLSPNDLQTFFRQSGITMPKISFEIVDSTYQIVEDSRADAELALDVEMAGSLAPGARIAVYFATNDEKGWVDALCAAIHDDSNQPTVLTVSWGAIEQWWEDDKRNTITELLEDAARFGMTVCAASGDDGSCIDANACARVTFPASSPLVLACGGTSLMPDGQEVVWNEGVQDASGGGISDCLRRPDWQTLQNASVQLPAPRRADPSFDGRGLPDVSGLASNSYSIYVHGCYVNGVGGTSAVAPLWAALVANLNEGLKRHGLSRMGCFNPLLYRNPALQKTFNDIVNGNNGQNGVGGYKARTGWDPCTGWGSPNGSRLLDELLK